MKKVAILVLCIICSFIVGKYFGSFNANSTSQNLQDFLAHVDSLCYSEPKNACEKLDSIETQIENMEDRTRHRYLLLKIKAQDKAFIPHTSDSLIKEVVSYYDQNGFANERMEAYYYLGSVHRDMHDAPGAARNYLKAVEIAQQTDEKIDTLILSNIYSQLSFIYFKLHDFKNALKFSKNEYLLQDRIGKLDERSLMDVATCYQHLGLKDSMQLYYDQAINLIKQDASYSSNTDIIAEQASFYAKEDSIKKATELVSLLDDHLDGRIPRNYYMAKAVYFQHANQLDSSAIYYQKVLESDLSLSGNCEEARGLMEVLSEQGKTEDALKYAHLYATNIDSFNLKQQQALAEDAHNEYQYNRDIEAEAAAYKKSSALWRTSVFVLLISFLLVGIITYIYMKYRKKLKHKLFKKDLELHDKESIIENQRRSISEQQSIIAGKEVEIQRNESIIELNQVRIEKQDKILAQREKIIEQQKERIKKTEERNTRLTKVKLNTAAGVSKKKIFRKFKDAANYKNGVRINGDDWSLLMDAINLADPDFLYKAEKRIKKLNERKLKICYLLKLGLSWSEIMVVTDIPRSSAHRLSKEISELLGDALDDSDV
ncbi:hypothetical protein C7Y71_009905 [Pseudoprevotella muciniphila]|uniref:Uncharacterized protein n=1 Tax=Pseudoprevotella muciniphila TaxID=2133944 RepID=A0A5P8E8L6_9BACT|nr:tetratricopeptide repeat protein [Pseudoprevotella muciniphila]QFQ13296.1 hypothetical protein C7Y71_009905 [Pseudoprevotella muciniphila]